MPDERLRAAREWRVTQRSYQAVRNSNQITLTLSEMDEALSAFAKLREDSAMREAAGLVCEACALNMPFLPDKPNIHISRIRDTIFCTAHKIHERLAQKGERNDDKR